MRRGLLGVVCVTAGVAATAGIGANILAASAASPPATVSIVGAVSVPKTYTVVQLAAMPQTTYTFEGHSYTGVLLETVVNASMPIYPTVGTPPGTVVKNVLLRATVTLSSGAAGASAGPVTVALGELDPGFGNNQGILAVNEDGSTLSAPELIMPQDATAARVVNPVNLIDVGVQSPPTTTNPLTPAGNLTGAVNIEHNGTTFTLTKAALAGLPQVTQMVSFTAGGTTRDTETGPLLSTVLTAAGITSDPDTYVASVSAEDGYVAVVTPAEATAGKTVPLMLSLLETPTAGGAATTNTPRLVPDGDVKGGRYNSAVSDLYVGEGPMPTTASVSCSPGSASTIAPTACTTTVTNINAAIGVAPTGSVGFTSSDNAGAFSPAATCTLAGSGASSSCTVSYTPGSGNRGSQSIGATYAGDSSHTGNSGTTTVIAYVGPLPSCPTGSSVPAVQPTGYAICVRK
jgi:hypothetical protein